MNHTMDARLSRIEQLLDVVAVEYHWVAGDGPHQLTPRRPGVQIITVSWATTAEEAIPDPSR